MTDYRRIHIPGATWFFTVNLAERKGNIEARGGKDTSDPLSLRERARVRVINGYLYQRVCQ
jgi:hypothetical protein